MFFKMPSKKVLKNNLCAASGCDNFKTHSRRLRGQGYGISIPMCEKHRGQL